MKVHLSKREGSSRFNGEFLPAGMRGMLSRKKGLQRFGYCVSIRFGYDDTWLVLQDNAHLTHIHVVYNSMVNQLLSNN